MHTKRILFVGGAGYVGSMVLPHLVKQHRIRVLDLRQPGTDCEYVAGDATDVGALTEAMQGVDAVIHGAMSDLDEADPLAAKGGFDVNVRSVYQTLETGNRVGIRHVVYLSSLSVFQDVLSRAVDESTPADAFDLYGLTKHLGEAVCRAAVSRFGISVNVLRLVWPTPDSAWPNWAGLQPPRRHYSANGRPFCATAATDVAQAMIAALGYHSGFQVFTISADPFEGRWSTAKARALLGWRPAFVEHGDERQ